MKIIPETSPTLNFDIYIFICHVCINGWHVSWIIAMSFYYK